MSLIFSELSLWEIGFRWAAQDPSKIWLRIPLEVRDHFRNLMHAILVGELSCETLRTEKWSPNCGSDQEFFIRHYMDQVYECIGGIRFDRKLLNWALIDRRELKIWCRRRGVSPPEFWFPVGAKDFPEAEAQVEADIRRDTNDLHKARRDALDAYFDLKADDPEKSALWAKIEKLDAESDRRSARLDHLLEYGVLPEVPDLDDGTTSRDQAKLTQKSLRNDQEARITVQRVARAIWKDHPKRRIAEMVRDGEFRRLCDSVRFDHEVVSRWLSQVAPPEVKANVGRPRKNIPTGD